MGGQWLLGYVVIMWYFFVSEGEGELENRPVSVSHRL